jgi:hypothetical protein
MGVTYLASAFSSDASCADLPLPLLGPPVSIEALVKLGHVIFAKHQTNNSRLFPKHQTSNSILFGNTNK